MSDFITALLRILSFGIYQGKQAKAEKDAKDRAEDAAECGAEIGEERLNLLPHTPFCRHCAA